MRRTIGLVLVAAVAELAVAGFAAKPAHAACRYSLDYEGEDRSWVGWSFPKVPYRDDDRTYKKSWMLLSARISVTLPVLSYACGRPGDAGGEWLWQGLPSMNLTLTMINDHSSAVVPASFNPRVLRFAFRHRWWPGADPKQAFYPNGRERAFGVIGTIWSHHSNGMYAPSFYDDLGDTTNDPAKAVNANLENGDFATNYVGAKGWFRWSELDDDGSRPEAGWFASFEYQYHHGTFFPGGLDVEKLGGLWGRHHLLASGQYRTGYQPDPTGDVQPKGDLGGAYWLYDAGVWCVADAHDAPVVRSFPCRGSLEAAWFVPKYLGALGIFVRADAGRNPLNIRFVENRNELMVGLMLDSSQHIARLGAP